MSLRFRKLHLRIQTGEGLFGTNISFEDGLVLLRAENTMGKSTCIQAIIYALGLEKMLGPSDIIPLPHVMTSYLEEKGREIPVLESEVLLEIENHQGEFMTIQRQVIGARDSRLVRTWAGALLSNSKASLPQRDYYVRDKGAAQYEDGFLRKLSEFVGWKLPAVRRFNGAECPLYMEAIFPLFIVEQKHGWAGIQSNLPTYFGIREMSKRCIEFVLNLDAAGLIEKRQRLEQRESELKSQWGNLVNLIDSTLKSISGRIVGLPAQPPMMWPLSVHPTIEIFREGYWKPLEEVLKIDEESLIALDSSPIETAEDSAPVSKLQLEETLQNLNQHELVAAELLAELQREKMHQTSAQLRLEALYEDRQRNKDALKLQKFGSKLGLKVIEHTCPTCQQFIADTLLSQGPIENPMSVEENIAFIENQINTFKHLSENSLLLIKRKDAELAAFRAEINELRQQVRSLRQTLVAPSSSPAIEAVRMRIALEAKIKTFEQKSSEIGEIMESFAEIVTEWTQIAAQKKSLPLDGFSHKDKEKMDKLENLLRDQLKQYGFSSLNVDTIEISQDTYRPTREGFDLGFDLSASDNVRTIWSYLNGLLELSAETDMNHLGFMIFDEPRQQEAAEISFERLLSRANKSKKRGQQIIFATSEPLTNVHRMIKNLDAQVVNFEGRVVSRIG